MNKKSDSSERVLNGVDTAPTSQPAADLVIYAPGGAVVVRRALTNEDVTIGRDPMAGIQLEGRQVSRLHAKVVPTWFLLRSWLASSAAGQTRSGSRPTKRLGSSTPS